jgi:hypothetical protein
MAIIGIWTLSLLNILAGNMSCPDFVYAKVLMKTTEIAQNIVRTQ